MFNDDLHKFEQKSFFVLCTYTIFLILKANEQINVFT